MGEGQSVKETGCFPAILNIVCTLESPTEILKILMCGSHLRNSVIGYSLGIRVTDAVTFENDCVKDPSGPFLRSSSSHLGCT